jgi:hypothetical protein
MNFLVIALIDYGITQTEHRLFYLTALTYLYRLDSQTVLSSVLPLLTVSNWCFRHIQLGKFEEIEDMSSFIKNVHPCQTAKLRPHTNVDTDYRTSTDFVLDAIRMFVDEDVFAMSNQLPVIISFCMTHLRQKKSMETLKSFITAIKNSFDRGVPEEVFHASDILAKIDAVNHDNLVFVCEPTPSPLRALQDRKVSLTDFLTLVIKLCGHLPTDNMDSLPQHLFAWGVTCGDMKTASVALDLYAVVVVHPSSDQTVFSVIENVCLIVRCLGASKYVEETTSRVAVYLNSSLRVLRRLAGLGFSPMAMSATSQTAASLLGLEGRLFELVLIELLNLMLVLFEDQSFILPDVGGDFGSVYFKVAQKTQDDHELLSKFTKAVLALPTEVDPAMFLIGFFPTMLSAPADAAVAGAVKALVDAFQRAKKDSVATTIACFSSEVLNRLFAQIKSPELLCRAATFFSGLVPIADKNVVLKRALFQLAAAVLSASRTHQIYERLNAIFVKATLEQSPEVFAVSTNLVVTAFAGEMTADMLVLDLDLEQTTPGGLGADESTHQFEAIQNSFCRALHEKFKAGGLVSITTDVATFPPLFPFEVSLFECSLIDEVANLCRRAQIAPFTGWADAIYRGHDPSDLLNDDLPPPRLNFNIPFQKLMDEIIGDVMATDEEEDKPETAQEYEFPKEEHNEYDITRMRMVTARQFLPSWKKCNEIVQKLTTTKVISLPETV